MFAANGVISTVDRVLAVSKHRVDPGKIRLLTLEGPPPVAMLQCGQVPTMARKSFSGVMRMASGRPSELQATAATNGVLPAAPRPRLPPRRSPPQNASSTCTDAGQRLAVVALAHGFHDLVFEQPGGVVGHPKVSAPAPWPRFRSCFASAGKWPETRWSRAIWCSRTAFGPSATSDDGSDGTESAAVPSVHSWCCSRIPGSGNPRASAV